jgi:hypothetical protein
MTMNRFFAISTAVLAVASAATPSMAALIRKADNATALNVAASWSPSTSIPTAADDVLWDSLLATPANGTVSVGNVNIPVRSLTVADPSGPIRLNSSGANSLITFSAASPLGLDLSSATQDITFNTNTRLAGSGLGITLNVGTGRTATFGTAATPFNFNMTGNGTHALVVTGAGDTVFNSTVTTAAGNGGNLTKAGTGSLIFNNAATFTSTTTTSAINAGTVLAGSGVVVTLSNAFSVNNSATLAGLGTFTTVTGVSITAGAIVSPGTASTNGTLSLTPGAASTVNLSAALAPVASGALRFDLGGSVQDKLTLTQGSLAIGTDGLEFDDFVFNTAGGLSAGTYTLISTQNAISGSLGTALSGAIGSSTGTVQFSADSKSIELVVVVPEPTVGLSLAAGAGASLVRRRTSRRTIA